MLTRDKAIRKNYVEKQAIKENNVGCFSLTTRKDLYKDEICSLLIGNLPKIERLFEETPKPFLYRIYRDGSFVEAEL